MSTGLYRLLRRRINRLNQSAGGSSALSFRLKSAFVGAVVALILVIGVGASLLISVDDSESADGTVQTVNDVPMVGLTRDSNDASPRMTNATLVLPAEPETRLGEANAAADIDGLKISAQSWRRGGLGSNALVTFTLRNDNPYPVKDVAIACAFSREDGSHLTDRIRVIPGDIRRKSRKTFAAMHVGYVNVNAAKAKCTLVAANRQ